MEITVKNLQKKIKINSRRIINLVRKVLKFEKVNKAVLSIVFVNRQKIAALNKKYLGRSYATDVLAFDLKDPRNKNKKDIQGDVIISVEQAAANARIYRTVLSDELALYIVHGILHLKGFDDHGKNETLKMRREEEKVMKHLGAASQKNIAAL